MSRFPLRLCSSVWRSALRACGISVAVLLSLLSPMLSHASDDGSTTDSSYYSTPTQWIEALRKVVELSSELLQRTASSATASETLQQRVDDLTVYSAKLRSQLTLLEEQSVTLESSLAQSQLSTTRLQTLLDESKTSLDALSLEWSSFKRSSLQVIARRESEVRTWRAVAVGGILGALVVGLIVGILTAR